MIICSISLLIQLGAINIYASPTAVEGKILNKDELFYLADFSADIKRKKYNVTNIDMYKKFLIEKNKCMELNK